MLRNTKQAMDICRTCGEMRYFHIDYTPKSSRRDIEEIVKCPQFVPKDNLEYLEWLYESKQRQRM